ncbi:MAG: type I-E CRISPR-associated protein Cas6/Cse3/CasE [Acidobacteria bacterium]|nr:type I-E CRISPR-associated protein Cas6/Cse3/CasE [Acidobacteriota bacterium]
MYLSRLILNPRSRQVQKDLSDCQYLHCTILRAFPQIDKTPNLGARAQFGLLYRLEINNHTGEVVILVQSHTIPNWEALPKGYLAENLEAQNPACKPVAEVFKQLKTGMRLVFRLRANPTRKIETKSKASGQKSNGKRIELQKESEQIDWLKRKAKIGGFRLLSLKSETNLFNLDSQPIAKDIGWRGNNNELQKLTFGAVLFQGVLEITNTEVFQQTLCNGIGSGKSYGFGLLSIASANVAN